MRAVCSANALRIRTLPVVKVGTDTGKRVIRDQVVDIHGTSLDEEWWFVEAPAGCGWCAQRYLSIASHEVLVSPSWPPVPNGLTEIRDLFGSPGNPLCTAGRISLPKPLKIGWKPTVLVDTLTCHKLVEDVFQSVFDAIFEHDLWDALDTYDGIYNYRPIKAGSKISTHGWGISIDLNASKNKLGAEPTMDPRIVAIFRDHGFVWGGNWSRPDGMHFQYARGY